MRSFLFSIMSLFISVFLLLLGNGLLSTLLILRGESEGFSDQYLGFLTSSYFFGAFIATMFASRMIIRMGHIRCFTFCSALLGVTSLAYLFFVDDVIWLLIRFITGFAVFAMYTVIESWLNGQTQDAFRSRVFSIYTFINLLAASASQQLLLLDSASSYVLFALVTMLVTAAIMPMSWTRLQQPHILVDMPTMSVKKVFNAAPIAVTGCLLSGFIMGPFWGLTPLFLSGLDYSASELAGFISISVLGGALLQYPVGYMSDKFDRRKVILISCAIASIVALLMVMFAQFFPGYRLPIVGLSILFCGFVLAIYPISVVHLVDRIHKDHLVAGSCSLLMVYGIGSFAGPSLAGLIMQYAGDGALPLYYTMILVIFAIILSTQLIRSNTIEVAEDYESSYTAMVRTSQNVLPLHPESEDELEEPLDRRNTSR